MLQTEDDTMLQSWEIKLLKNVEALTNIWWGDDNSSWLGAD